MRGWNREVSKKKGVNLAFEFPGHVLFMYAHIPPLARVAHGANSHYIHKTHCTVGRPSPWVGPHQEAGINTIFLLVVILFSLQDCCIFGGKGRGHTTKMEGAASTSGVRHHHGGCRPHTEALLMVSPSFLAATACPQETHPTTSTQVENAKDEHRTGLSLPQQSSSLIPQLRHQPAGGKGEGCREWETPSCTCMRAHQHADTRGYTHLFAFMSHIHTFTLPQHHIHVCGK